MTPALYRQGNIKHKSHTISEFLGNRRVILRILLIFLSIFLLICCVFYALGEITELVLTDFFCPTKELEVIRKHSKQINSAYGDYDDCWVSKGLKVNNQNLYSINSYDLKYSDNNGIAIFKCILFSIIGCWLLFCFISFTCLLIRDLIRFKGNYYDRQFRKNNMKQEDDTNDQVTTRSCCKRLTEFMQWYWFYYMKYFGPDKTLWALFKFAAEIFEISLQTVVLSQYAGVQLFYNQDSNNIALPWYEVMIFIGIISTNCISIGVLWLLYVFKHDFFRGNDSTFC